MQQSKKSRVTLKEWFLVLGSLGVFPTVSCNANQQPTTPGIKTTKIENTEASRVSISVFPQYR
jgi:hypothetical protein